MTWRWFRFAWAGFGGEMAWLVVGSALVAALHAGFAWLWKAVIDAVQTGQVDRAALWCAAAGVGQTLLYVSVQGTRARMNERIQKRARDRVFDHLLRLDAATLGRWRTGDLVTRLTDDVSTEKLAWFLCSGVFRAWEALLVVLACLVGMLWIDPVLTAEALLPLPLLALMQARAGRALGERAARVQREVSRVGDVVQDVFDGVRVVQARGLGPLAKRAFGEAAARQAEAEVQNARATQAQFVTFGYGWQVALAALLGSGGARVMAGELGAGDFLAFNGFVMTLVFPMFDFGAFVVRWRQAAASLDRLEELLAAPVAAPTTVAADAGLRLPSRFTTSRGAFDLGGDVSVDAGQLLAVTGPVGAGKSTLLQALAGQLPVDGAVPAVAPAAWVPQDPVILSLDVARNILLADGRPAPEIVRAACLEDDLARLPAGLDTPVGVRGVTLSGGQQQRVQLARALASGRPVLLLDDATSALDPDTEARFWDGLDRRALAVVVVTHRPATLARADLVLYLRAGEAAARGTHAELLATSGAYRGAYGGPSGAW